MNNHKRVIQHNRIIQYIIVLVSVLVMSWEQAYSQPVLWQSQQLPEDAIRLRVIPNSDRPVDQWLKLRVRDVVTEQMVEWTPELSSSEQAQDHIFVNIEAIERIVYETLQHEGFSYPVNVRLGQSEFPMIAYGEHVYPTGNYQALIIEIGDAQGQNWWCVLYPPLCLIDIVSAKVVDENIENNHSKEPEISKTTETSNANKVQVKFFLAKFFK